MRSPADFIVSKDEVHGYADHWLSAALKLEYHGTKCNASTLIQILLIAATRVVSLFAACRDLADALRTKRSAMRWPPRSRRLANSSGGRISLWLPTCPGRYFANPE